MATEFWYRISNQFEITVHDFPDLTLNHDTKYWIEAVFNNRTHTTSFDNKFKLYDYNIFNNTIEPSEIRELNLSCAKMYDTTSNSWGTRVCFEIKDKEGITIKKNFGNNSIVNGKETEEVIIDAISFMKKFGTYKSWEIIEIKKDNFILIDETNKLRDKIKELELQNEKLKNSNKLE